MGGFQIRTDLALEARESIAGGEEELRGVVVEENDKEEIQLHITRVKITTKNGAKAMNKPIGTYITLEAPDMSEPDEDYHREISRELAAQICSLIPDRGKERSVLVVGLGNRNVTADALGPRVIDNLAVTRHILKEYGKAAYNREKMNVVSGIVPGVLATTGMEAAEIVKGVVEQTLPDLVIVVDALAARSTRRLNRTIQITDTGIQPGSGVGNHRTAFTEESLHIPVIAIGVPTVVDAATIVSDAIQKMEKEYGKKEDLIHLDRMRTLSELSNMYVTGKNIDETIKRLGFTLSEALNMALEL